MIDKVVSLRLRQIRLEATDICSYEFVAASPNEALPPFTAGSHIDLRLPHGITRSYSIANPPHDASRYIVAVKLESNSRGGSAWMHESLRVGQVLQATLPANDFPVDEAARCSVFVAGGIGITPILSMISHLDRLGRSWRLHYASRSVETTAFIQELNAIDAGRGWAIHYYGSSATNGLNLRSILGEGGADSSFYCCGPTRMIDSFVSVGTELGIYDLHYERFAAADSPATEGGFEVVLQRSGLKLFVEPGKTILETLLDHNVAVSYACSTGVCGSCRTSVLEGVPDHRDNFLDPDQKKSGDSVIVCCSGSLTKQLVLDI